MRALDAASCRSKRRDRKKDTILAKKRADLLWVAPLDGRAAALGDAGITEFARREVIVSRAKPILSARLQADLLDVTQSRQYRANLGTRHDRADQLDTRGRPRHGNGRGAHWPNAPRCAALPLARHEAHDKAIAR